MACNCGKPNCIQCLIESSTKIQLPPLDTPEMEGIILVIRPIPACSEADHNARQHAMTSIFHTLQSLTLLCSELKLSASINSKQKRQ